MNLKFSLVCLVFFIPAVFGYSEYFAFPTPIISPDYDSSSRDMQYGLFSVGWSEEGYFAYATYYSRDDEKEVSTYFGFNIQNLKTDQIEYIFEIDTDRESLALNDILADYSFILNMELSNYSINRIDGELISFPLDNQEETVINIDITPKADPSMDFYWIDTIEIEYISSEYGKKTIYTDNHPECLGMELFGGIISPYGDYIAIIVQEAYPDIKYVPFHWKPLVIGSQMKKGF